MSKPKKVLLVDDDETAIFISTRIINRAGFCEEALTARNGREAHEILFKHCTHLSESECDLDLILLDNNMPGMDGFEFLETYGKMNLCCKPRIVLLSSSNHPMDLERGKQHNVSAIHGKPLNKESLTAIFEFDPKERDRSYLD